MTATLNNLNTGDLFAVTKGTWLGSTLVLMESDKDDINFLCLTNMENMFLEATSFKLEFKDGAFVDFDLIQEKVEDAGFFVGSIEIVFNDNLKAENDKHNLINGNLFHFFSDVDTETNVFTLVDKKFIRKSEYELISDKTSHLCYETGLHTATCCSKHDNLKSNKVFHLKSSL